MKNLLLMVFPIFVVTFFVSSFLGIGFLLGREHATKTMRGPSYESMKAMLEYEVESNKTRVDILRARTEWMKNEIDQYELYLKKLNADDVIKKGGQP